MSPSVSQAPQRLLAGYKPSVFLQVRLQPLQGVAVLVPVGLQATPADDKVGQGVFHVEGRFDAPALTRWFFEDGA